MKWILFLVRKSLEWAGQGVCSIEPLKFSILQDNQRMGLNRKKPTFFVTMVWWCESSSGRSRLPPGSDSRAKECCCHSFTLVAASLTIDLWLQDLSHYCSTLLSGSVHYLLGQTHLMSTSLSTMHRKQIKTRGKHKSQAWSPQCSSSESLCGGLNFIIDKWGLKWINTSLSCWNITHAHKWREFQAMTQDTFGLGGQLDSYT